MENKNSKSILIPLVFILLLWIVKIIQSAFNIDLTHYGIYPHRVSGLAGIPLSPFIHSDYNHLISNSIPILILGMGLFYVYKTSAIRAAIFIYIVTSLLVWLFARNAYHIGASGLIYGFAGYLFFGGVFRRDVKSIALALGVVFIYGGMIWGVLPLEPNVSYESHLFGGITGTIAAFILRKKDPIKKYDWEDEDDDVPVEKLEISYRKDITQ